MKTNFLLKSREERRKPLRTTLLTLLIIFAVLFGIKALFPDFSSGIFNLIARPFWSGERAASEAISAGQLDSKEALMKENADLRDRISTMEAKESAYNLLEQENQNLKELFDRKDKKDLVLATVLKKPPASAYDTLIIDVGSRENIQVGNRVLVGSTIAIGEVVEVGRISSKVKLYSTPGEKYDVRIASTSIDTQATGLGNGNFFASLPREIKITEGDDVVIPSLSPQLFAKVSAISTDPARAFQTILFKMPVNIALLSYVEVARSDAGAH